VGSAFVGSALGGSCAIAKWDNETLAAMAVAIVTDFRKFDFIWDLCSRQEWWLSAG
jgi:hypothetical protein